MQNSVAKKIFAVGSAVAMTLSMVVPFAAHAAQHAAGTNVSSSDGTVWMITTGGTRRAYTSAGAFLSYGFNSWSQVVPASAEDLALPVDAAGFIPPQDGTIFCATASKGTDVSGECSLVTMGTKAAFTSAAVFTGLGFSFSRAQYGDSSFLSKSSNVDNTTAAHRAGVLVNNNGTVQLVGATGLLGIPDLATFNSWGYSFANVVPANAADKALPQTGVMAARMAGQLSPSWTTNPTPTPTPGVINGSVSVSLASDTPAAGTLVSNSSLTSGSQTGADLAHFNFTGSGTVTQVVVKRIGVSADSSINNVYLYMGNNRITDAGTFSQGIVTFGNSAGLFTVNGTVTISVRVDVAAQISGQTIGAQLSSFTVANGTPMSTSVSGNIFTIAQVGDVASVKLSVSSGNTTITGSGAAAGTNGTINAGTMNANLWGTTVTVSQRAVKLRYIQFKQIGSIAQDAIQNLKLMVDGSVVGSTTSITNSGANNNVVIFDLNGNPVNLSTGSHTIELHGDVVKGTSYNYNFTLQTSTDALFQDSSYNVNIPLTFSAGGAIFQLSPGITTINSGTVSIQQDATFTATQFVKNASQVTLGQWTMKAYGEDVKVQNLQVQLVYASTTPLTSSEGFNNLSVSVNGGQVGSSQSALFTVNTGSCGATSCTYTFGTTNLFTIPAGTTVTVTVKGDSILATSTGATSVTTNLIVPISALQGVTSFSLSPSVAATYTGVSLSVSTSTGTLSKNTGYSNQSLNPNATHQKIGSFTIQASNADGVRVNSLVVALSSSTPTSGTVFTSGTNPTGLANLTLVTPDFPSGTTPVSPSASNSFSVNFVVPMNQTATVDVYADISNVSGNVIATLSGTGIGSTSNQAVTLTGVAGQTITIAAGTLTAGNVTLQTSSPVAQFVVSGSTNRPAATFNFVATTGGVTIQELSFWVATATSATTIPVTSVTVAGVTSPVIFGLNAGVGATSTITGLNISVPASFAGVDVPVTMNLANVGVGGLPSNQVFTLNLTSVKYLTGSSSTYLNTGLNVASNSFDLVGSFPTVTLAASGQSLTGGTVMIGKVTVSANAAGNVVLTQLPIRIVNSGGASIAAGSTITVTDDVSGQNLGSLSPTLTNGVDVNGSATTTLTFTTDNQITAGQSKTYDIFAQVTGTLGSSGASSVNLSLGQAYFFQFTDVNGNATLIRGASAAVGTPITYMVNYPTNQVTTHN